MYWSDIGRHTISRSRCVAGLRCDSEEDLVTDLLDTVDGLAVDAVTQVIYWTDAGRRLIEAMKLPAGPRTVLVWQELDSPRAIALHYDSGYNNVRLLVRCGMMRCDKLYFRALKTCRYSQLNLPHGTKKQKR